jgi:hypothetical protein
MHCEKIAVTDMSFRQPAGIEFLLKEGNSAAVMYERHHTTSLKNYKPKTVLQPVKLWEMSLG